MSGSGCVRRRLIWWTSTANLLISSASFAAMEMNKPDQPSYNRFYSVPPTQVEISPLCPDGITYITNKTITNLSYIINYNEKMIKYRSPGCRDSTRAVRASSLPSFSDFATQKASRPWSARSIDFVKRKTRCNSISNSWNPACFWSQCIPSSE